MNLYIITSRFPPASKLAGIQRGFNDRAVKDDWIPAFAGMTE